MNRWRRKLQRQKRITKRTKSRELGLHEAEEALEKALARTKELKLCHKKLATTEKNLPPQKGDHAIEFDKVLVDLGIAKTAYFGHAYICKVCSQLCTSAVAAEITRPFLLRSESQKSRESDLSGFQGACSERVKLITRFLK